MKNTITYEFLKKNGLILFETIVGSQAYGTSTPDSDIDKKFIYILPKENIFGFDYIEFLEVNADYSGWEIKKFLELIKVNNPTAMELLNSPEHCILFKSPYFDDILLNKDKFISKLALKSFSGYAVQQIKKATGLNKKQNLEAKKVTRKDLLDFVFVIQDGQSIPWRIWNKNNYYEVKFCGLTKVPNTRDLYALYYDTNAHLCFSESMSDEEKTYNKKVLKSIGNPMGFGYKGLVKESEMDNKLLSNQLRLSSIPKSEDMLVHISYNKDSYSEHCKDYNSYVEWLENRNETRYVEVSKHGQKIDGKNMLHCIRLIDMGIEIAEGKGIIIERPNAEFLLSIRKGKLNLYEILDLAKSKLDGMEEIFNNSNLPDTPDYELIDNLLINLRANVYNKSNGIFKYENMKITKKKVDKCRHNWVLDKGWDGRLEGDTYCSICNIANPNNS